VRVSRSSPAPPSPSPEAIIKKVIGASYQVRCTFNGPRGTTAKCDFAIPSKSEARILFESEGYGATGSRQTDVLGDVHTIITAKRPDTALLFFTDSLTWKGRKSDPRKLVDYGTMEISLASTRLRWLPSLKKTFGN
jgi:hypothetical protein